MVYQPMVCMRVAFHKNDGNHENDGNNEGNSDSYKQGFECWTSGTHGKRGNDENHGNLGCEPRVPQSTGLEIPKNRGKKSRDKWFHFHACTETAMEWATQTTTAMRPSLLLWQRKRRRLDLRLLLLGAPAEQTLIMHKDKGNCADKANKKKPHKVSGK